MALPTLAKSWLFSVNNSDTTGTTGVGYGVTMYAWKVGLTTLGSNPWTVVLSSDGLSNAGAADYWTDASKCTTHEGGAGNRSWIVLVNAALGGLQMCVELTENGGGHDSIMGCYLSEGGLFTGGSLLVRPTATDEVDTSNGAGRHNWTDAVDCSVTPAKINIAMSDDGECTRWWIYVNGYCPCFYVIDKPRDPSTGWSQPWACIACVDWYASTAFRPTYSYLNDIKTNTAWRYNGTKQQFFLTSEGHTTAALGQYQTYENDIEGGWPMYPMGMFCDVAGARGRHGVFFDLWWGSTTRGEGDHYPADLSRQFVQIGDLIHPWLGDGTIMSIA